MGGDWAADKARRAGQGGNGKVRLRHAAISAGFLGMVFFMACPLHGSDWAFVPQTMSGGHIGPVTAVLGKGDSVISAGEDGFLEVWTGVSSDAPTVGRFQVSPYRIVAMAGRPGGNEVSLVETNGLGLFRLSAWNYAERRKIFRHEFGNPIVHVSYSMGGSFVIAGGAGAAGLVFVDSSNGNVLPSPPGLGGTVALAVTGRNERNMMLYLSSGVISYRDLDTGAETHRFGAPANLGSPVLFGGNRFIAGLSPQGLTVVDAVSGAVVARDASVTAAGSLLSSAGDTLYALVNRLADAELRRYSVDGYGNLVMLAFHTLPLPAGGGRYTALNVYGDAAALGTSNGGLVVVGPEGRTRALAAEARTRIVDAAVSGETIAFVAENGTLGFIPLNHAELSGGETIRAERGRVAYNRVTPFAAEEEPYGGMFVFWQDRNVHTLPSILSADPGRQAPGLAGLSFRFPLRAVASFAGRAMFMDSAGNVSVLTPARGGSPFAFSSIGLMDAAFMDADTLILGRSAVTGNTPFLSLNVVTGETVPLPYPAQAGVIMHRGSSGGVYAATVSPQPGGTVTSVSRLDPRETADSQRIFSVQGEHTRFSIAEIPGGIAATVGGEGGAIHSSGPPRRLDRTPGFPYRLLDGGRYLISLDRDGNLAWHDNRSGRLLAVFWLSPDGWALQRGRDAIRGGF